MKGSSEIKSFLGRGIEEEVYPGAVLLVAKSGQIFFFQALGHLTLTPEPLPMREDTIFDLASLTKPLATALATMNLIDKGKIGLDQPISQIINSVLPEEKKNLTPRLLLCHSAGLAHWKPYYLDLIDYQLDDRKQVLRGMDHKRTIFISAWRRLSLQ